MPKNESETSAAKPGAVEIYDGTAQLAEELDYLNTLHAATFGPSRPFYYKASTPPVLSANGCYYAPSGWYQWTEGGLRYIGETILEEVTDAKP